jgi:hypothetical protein
MRIARIRWFLSFIYDDKWGTHHTLLLTATKSKSLAAHDGEIALRELPKVFLKRTRVDDLVVKILIKVRVAYDIIPDSLVLKKI